MVVAAWVRRLEAWEAEAAARMAARAKVAGVAVAFVTLYAPRTYGSCLVIVFASCDCHLVFVLHYIDVCLSAYRS